jgi:hypothetical protein
VLLFVSWGTVVVSAVRTSGADASLVSEYFHGESPDKSWAVTGYKLDPGAAGAVRHRLVLEREIAGLVVVTRVLYVGQEGITARWEGRRSLVVGGEVMEIP